MSRLSAVSFNHLLLALLAKMKMKRSKDTSQVPNSSTIIRRIRKKVKKINKDLDNLRMSLISKHKTL